MQATIDQTDKSDATELERVVLEASAVGQAATEGAATVPQRILIAPAGQVRSASGSFLVDRDAMEATVAAFQAHGTDIPIDYEHQTLGGPYSSPNGQAPAAGWIKSLIAVSSSSVVEGADGRPLANGLWAEVTWTDEAREKLAARQYRYISPVALVRRSDRRLVGIHSVALTNKPAIVGMLPVVNRIDAPRPVPGGVGDWCAVEDRSIVAMRELLNLGESADADEVLLAGADRIRTLQDTMTARQAADRVAAAMSAGKLTAAQRDWAMDLARRDPAEFDKWQAAAPQVVALGRTAPPRDQTGTQALSRRALESAARAEWQANKSFLEQLCSEEAYVANALRDGAAQVE
jgi:phage I-like protein